MRSSRFAKRTQTPDDPIDIYFALVDTLNEENEQPISSLCVGQPHVGTHPNILSLVNDSLQAEEAIFSFPYSPLQGSPETLAAICRLYKEYYPTVDYAKNEVMISNGATQALHNALGIFVDKGDDVLLVEPYYSAYVSLIAEMKGNAVKIPTAAQQFRLSGKLLQQTLNDHPQAKILILNYPNNPSGVDLTEDELTGLATVIKHYPELTVIIDDVYCELTNGKHLTLLAVAPELKDQCIVINSLSKGCAAPGVRAGTAGASAEIIALMTKQQAKSTSSISTLTERTLIAAVEVKANPAYGYAEWLEDCKEIYSQNRQIVAEQLSKLGFNIIQGGHGLFVLASAVQVIGLDIPDEMEFKSLSGNTLRIENLHQKIGSTRFNSDGDIVKFLLYTAGVALVPGSAFGIDETLGFMRISCAKHATELEQALILMKRALDTIPELALKNRPSLHSSKPGLFTLHSKANSSLELPSQTVVSRP